MCQFINYRKVNKLFFLISFFLILFGTANSTERSKKEIKIGVFLEDYKKFGKFNKINNTPIGMFPETADNFSKKQVIAQKKFIQTFITKKGQMEKNIANVILGMGYFEFFYMQQLKDNVKSIETFERKYPKINAATKKNIKKIYGLNKARKAMREALGLSLDNTPEEAIERYHVLYKLLKQAELIELDITKEDNKNIIIHNEISKNISNLISLVEDKISQRLTDKKFEIEYSNSFKKLTKNINEAKSIKDYNLLNSFIIEINKYKNNSLSQLLSGLKITDYVLQDIKKERLKKKYEQNLSNANFDDFSRNELSLLGDITKATKDNKNFKSNEIQLQILNLENGGIPINRFLDFYRKELNVKLDDINLQLASAADMSDWRLSDWANAWRSPLPKSYLNDAGLEISFSTEDIESIKAQLAIKNFKEIITLETFNILINNGADKFQKLANNLNIQDQNFEFVFTLDDFAKSFGDTYGLDINNYADLTDLANAQYNANWSVKEYASAYQDNVDMVNALQSGAISSFQAGEIAAAANKSIQEVADTITAAATAGVSVDLEAIAQGAGYGSFADAVAAYNAEHGTSYTVEQAKDELGQ